MGGGRGIVAVVDYGTGNLHSVRNALEAVGAQVCVTNDADQLAMAKRIVLPGVGAFGTCISQLKASGLLPALERAVIDEKKPLLGICVGMQILADRGLEDGEHAGLGWISGEVRALEAKGLRIPHVGWNDVRSAGLPGPLSWLKGEQAFYFTHSYQFVPADPSVVAGICDYGGPVVAAVQQANIFATQFHPEKSQQMGLQVLKAFLTWEV